MIILSASMAVVDTAQAQMQKPPGYGSMQAQIGHRQPTQDDLQPTQGDLEKIDKDNQQPHLPASQDGITGAQRLTGEFAGLWVKHFGLYRVKPQPGRMSDSHWQVAEIDDSDRQ
jgi:hypothetical protein